MSAAAGPNEITKDQSQVGPMEKMQWTASFQSNLLKRYRRLRNRNQRAARSVHLSTSLQLVARNQPSLGRPYADGNRDFQLTPASRTSDSTSVVQWRSRKCDHRTCWRERQPRATSDYGHGSGRHGKNHDRISGGSCWDRSRLWIGNRRSERAASGHWYCDR